MRCVPIPKLAVVLSGGGARAAYQAGVLEAIAKMRASGGGSNPFSIVSGTSAGAINAAAIAAGAQDFGRATEGLARIWSSLHVGDIYRADTLHLFATGARFLAAAIPGLRHRRPASLLDNAPLARLLERVIRFPDVRKVIAAGQLDALTVTASSYTTGMSVSFCAARAGLSPWERAQRVGVHADIGVEHLMASSAIPFVFPPQPIGDEYFGDGAVRQVAPTSPALHMGANRILVIGAARGSVSPAAKANGQAPSLAQVGGHVLSSIFTDALGTDLEKVQLVNAAARQIPGPQLAQSPVPLWEVELCVMTPSIPLEDLALDHVASLPRTLRGLISGVGGTHSRGAGFLSYLLFEEGYTTALIDLGRRDAEARRDELEAILADL